MTTETKFRREFEDETDMLIACKLGPKSYAIPEIKRCYEIIDRAVEMAEWYKKYNGFNPDLGDKAREFLESLK